MRYRHILACMSMLAPDPFGAVMLLGLYLLHVPGARYTALWAHVAHQIAKGGS
jgi:hypothetical protein